MKKINQDDKISIYSIVESSYANILKDKNSKEFDKNIFDGENFLEQPKNELLQS